MPAMWAGTSTAVIISEIFHRLVVDLVVFLAATGTMPYVPGDHSFCADLDSILS